MAYNAFYMSALAVMPQLEAIKKNKRQDSNLLLAGVFLMPS